MTDHDAIDPTEQSLWRPLRLLLDAMDGEIAYTVFRFDTAALAYDEVETVILNVDTP